MSLQPLRTAFPILNQAVVSCPISNCCFLTSIKFLCIQVSPYRRQVRWSGIDISLRIFQFAVIHTVKGLSIVNEAEVDVFLEFSYFFYDPMNVGNMISGSSALSKSSLNIWKFLVQDLIKGKKTSFKHVKQK